MDKIAREKEYALKELSKGVSYFETHLGLRIEALSDGARSSARWLRSCCHAVSR